MRLLTHFVGLIYKLISFRLRAKPMTVHLKISAGEKGWESIEFKELQASASEWLGADRVTAFTYRPDISVREELRECSHYFYDPRTGYDYSDSPRKRRWQAYLRAIKIGLVCALRGITPIAYVTDFSQRDWRAPAFLVTAHAGFIFCLMSVRSVPAHFLPHPRVAGPMPMALSKKRAETLSLASSRNRPVLMSFSGSLYEPRKTFISQLKKRCLEKNHQFVVHSRKMGGQRRSDDLYWSDMQASTFVVSTAGQNLEDDLDFRDVKQMVYRYSEATLAGSCLIADIVLGVEQYFEPGVDFVVAETPEAVVDVLDDFLRRPEHYLQIAENGRRKAEMLSSSWFFWNTVDEALGLRSMKSCSER
jgi:hypothetical protein